MKPETSLMLAPDISRLIYSVRGQRVILDTDLAAIYDVPTKRLNEQFRRNSERFPQDFAFQLTPGEWADLKSQANSSQGLTSSKPQFEASGPSAASNRSQFATGSQKHRDPRFLPIAFTEHGALMAAYILSSPRAAAMSVYVIRAFVKMREDLVANAAILKRLAEIDKTLLVHDSALREIYQKLRPLLEPPPQPPKPEIGFHVKEDAVPYRVSRKMTR